jgi:hypothetical protein
LAPETGIDNDVIFGRIDCPDISVFSSPVIFIFGLLNRVGLGSWVKGEFPDFLLISDRKTKQREMGSGKGGGRLEMGKNNKSII